MIILLKIFFKIKQIFNKMILKIIFLIVIILILLKIIKVDQKDNTHPFGTDDEKNKKVIFIPSDENGVNTFYGKLEDNDDIQSSLKKIKYLSYSSQKDIIWRKSLIGAIILIIISSIFYFDFKFQILLLITSFITIYFVINYFIRHVLFYRVRIIDKHIKNIKKLV